METTRWMKNLNILGLVALLVAFAYFNPVSKISPSIRASLNNYIHGNTPEVDKVVDNLAARYRKQCPKHQFTAVRHVSRAPDIMIIDDFLTKAEADALLRAA
jgi:hypothetical protein